MNFYRDPRLDELADDYGRETNPGVISGNALRLFRNQAGRGERDAVLRLQRLAGGDPLKTIEGYADLHRGTAAASADAAIQADELERAGIDQARGRQSELLMNRENRINQERLFREQEKEQRRADLVGALGQAFGIGADLWNMRLLTRLANGQGGGVPQ